MAKIDIGDDVVLTATFTTKVAGVDTPTDPTTVSCKVKPPTAAAVTLAPTKVATGVWQAVFPVTESGEHWYRFAGTGAAKGAEEGAFVAEPQRVT